MNAPQGSAEWLSERAGCVTASRANDVLAKIKTGEAATRRKYRLQIVTERLTGLPVTNGFKNAAMQWGTDTEPLARLSYEVARSEIVQEVGFIRHSRLAWVGASPDGMIGDDGLLEIKCPESTTHLEWIERGGVPTEHYAQIMFQLFVTERKWCEFVSFDPRFPEHLRLYIFRVERDDKYIENLSIEVSRFLKEADDLYARLMEQK